MSRGNRGFLSGLALLGLSLLLVGGPAEAALVSSGAAGGVDNLPPEPVGAVAADTTTVGTTKAIVVTWTLSPSDFARPQPVGSDVTSGGTFSGVNDVVGYAIQRIIATPPESHQLGVVASSGVASFIDTALNSSTGRITGGVTYTVYAVDAAGNASAGVTSEEVSLAPAGQAGVSGDDYEPVVTARMTLDMSYTVVSADYAGFRHSFVDALCDVITGEMPDFLCSRIEVVSVTPGSVVVDYRITPSSDPQSGNPATVIATLNSILASDPGALTAVEPTLGSVTSASTISGADINFGNVPAGASPTRSITVANRSSNVESVVSGTVRVSGDGFSAAPTSFAVAGRDSADIVVTFSAATVGNINGTYDGVVSIATNDTASAATVVKVTATVVGGVAPATLVVNPTALNFGPSTKDSSKVLALTLKNTGGAALTGTIARTGSAFGISASSLSLSGGDSVVVNVTFTPMDTVSYSGTVTITTNARTNPTVTVNVLGKGVPAGFAPALPGDFDGTGTVDFDDFFLFADAFGTTRSSSTWSAMYDLDNSGAVDFDDFFLFADAFGTHL